MESGQRFFPKELHRKHVMKGSCVGKGDIDAFVFKSSFRQILADRSPGKQHCRVVIIDRSERYFPSREQEMTPLCAAAAKQKKAKSLLPVRRVAKHDFSREASSFFLEVISFGINHISHKSQERDHHFSMAAPPPPNPNPLTHPPQVCAYTPRSSAVREV